ncbi:2Fe-2S iron-sulfur cluster-binding protein [Anaeromicropila populeti]|uniref:Succinate dehydrogenase / fumarate reductase iron-sulfur subunit n=1 Tax=Anaeromicropila populeti TaxID=37658 RepID=A0A1I6ICU4_9FIRM|nr:2Fe-2S iron-sulfur cluster-binding protein [Anaeromicropila populeti]SFR64587.1 succinate dehydrogenase / fumarate reductase iron-sulfur subunit [Anaeromicropila populeti]
MEYKIVIKRFNQQENFFYEESFIVQGKKDKTVADALNELNNREILLNEQGKEAELISWECSCNQKKCGACAMLINGRPKLACSSFLVKVADKENTIHLAPLKSFELVKDLKVNRSVIQEGIKRIISKEGLSDKYYVREDMHDLRYQASRCLTCGCCLEVCPIYQKDHSFLGAIKYIVYLKMNLEVPNELSENMEKQCLDEYYNKCIGCKRCNEICPISLRVKMQVLLK